MINPNHVKSLPTYDYSLLTIKSGHTFRNCKIHVTPGDIIIEKKEKGVYKLPTRTDTYQVNVSFGKQISKSIYFDKKNEVVVKYRGGFPKVSDFFNDMEGGLVIILWLLTIFFIFTLWFPLRVYRGSTNKLFKIKYKNPIHKRILDV